MTPPLLLYCILAPPVLGSVPEAGVGGAPLRLLDDPGAGALAALVSPLPQRPDRHLLDRPQVEDVLSFQAAIAALHIANDVLPARFGCVLTDEGALLAHLQQRAPLYRAALRRIAGCAEMGVRLTCTAPPQRPPPPGDTGAAYLRARQAHYALLAAQEQDAARAAARVQERLVSLAREALVLPLRREEAAVVMSVAFLVQREAVAAFRARFHELGPDPAGRLTLLGPWPPFSFTPPPEDEAARGGS